MSLMARVNALKLAEQAVSVFSDGPLKSKMYDILLASSVFMLPMVDNVSFDLWPLRSGCTSSPVPSMLAYWEKPT